ncbi:MAG: hypothetical protein RL459_1281, partial [Pseudomonadota bacterium]
GGSKVGAMIGARGCVEAIAGTSTYLVTVAWQGLAPISSPAPTCGKDLYDGASGSPCANDLCRRVVTTMVQVGNMAP